MTESNRQESSILIITSMHRSGSSLTASLLQSAGLHIGRRLMQGAETNIKGHFENLDFWNFHQQVFQSQGVNEEGWTLQEKIEVENQYVEEAKKLVATNAISSLWGWKDPRTTLFLEFWANLLPEANFLMLFRYPWEVVSSLYRGGQPYTIFQKQPELAVKFWLHYNQKILNFSNAFPQRCFLVSLNNFLKHTPSCIDALNQKFKINLSLPNSKIYEPSLLHRQDPEGHRSSLINHYYPEAIALYTELEARGWQSTNLPDTSWQQQLKFSPYRVWAFQDWLTVSNYDQENQKLQKQLDVYKAQLEQNTQILEQTQKQLHQTEAELQQKTEELNQRQSQLNQTQEVLEKNESQLRQTQAELEQTQSELHQTYEIVEKSQAQLRENEEVLEKSVTQLSQRTEELNQTQSQLHQTQEELERSQSQLHQTHEELNLTQSQLHETEQVLEKSLAQLHETEEVLQQSVTQLSQRTEELNQTKSQLHQTQEELNQTQSQLHETEAVLEQSMSQLHETEAVLEQSISQQQQKTEELNQTQTQLHQTHEELNQTQTQLHQTQEELERSQSQLHHTQEELERLQSQLHYIQERTNYEKAIAGNSDTNIHTQYKLLIWDGWYAYLEGDLEKMSKCLQESLKYTSLSPTETILNWLETFASFASPENGSQFALQKLIDSREWQQLTRRITAAKSLIKR